MRTWAVVVVGCALGSSACGNHHVDATRESAAPESSMPQVPPSSLPVPVQSASSSATPDPLTVTFVPQKAMVGFKWSTRDSSGITLLSADPTAKKFQNTRESDRTFETLAVDGDLAIKARVTYLKHQTIIGDGGAPLSTRADVVMGKSYIVERKDGKLVETNDKLERVNAEEKKILDTDFAEMGLHDPFTDTLTAKPRTVGEPVDDMADALQKKLVIDANASAVPGETVDCKDVKVSFTKLAELDGRPAGLFDVVATVARHLGARTMTMRLRGQFLIRVDNAFVEDVVLDGPLAVSSMSGPESGSVSIKARTALLGE